jgi:hypothetical protein
MKAAVFCLACLLVGQVALTWPVPPSPAVGVAGTVTRPLQDAGFEGYLIHEKGTNHD